MTAQRLPSGLPRPRAVLFDWDNTLVDTWITIGEALNATFAAFDMPLWSPDEVKRRVRGSVRDAFPATFGAEWERARDIFYATYRARHLETLTARPDAGAMLAELKARGLYLGIVSNKQGNFLRQEAAHLGWTAHFGGIVGAMDAPRDKPAVDPVDLALAPAGLRRSVEVWFVGDADIDLECAHNAGCTPVLLHPEALPPEALSRHPPALQVSGCKELLALLAEP
jgi:phosphoglycolate phosphatase